MPVLIDQEIRDHLVLAVDSPTNRVSLSLGHEDGMELHRLLTEYYGKVEFAKPAAIEGKRRTWLQKLFGGLAG